MAEKVIPHNLDAEVSVLGSMLIDQNLIKIAKTKINANDFYDSRNQECFKIILKLDELNLPVDYITVYNEVQNQGLSQKIGGPDYLSYLFDYVSTTVNFEFYIGIVLDLSLKRKIIDTANQISKRGFETDLTSEEYIDETEKAIFELSKLRKSSEFAKIRDICEDVVVITERNKNARSKVTGLYTGFECIDSITAGFQKEELIILAARPAMGKSAFAMNLAVNVAKKNKDSQAVVAVFSLEMGNDQLVSRMIASESTVNGFNIRTGNLNPDEWRRFEASSYKLGELNIYFDDSSSVSINDIRAKCRKLSQDVGLDFVVIDYLQLVGTTEKTSSRQEEVSKISKSLKQMARELKIPVLALSQLSRDVEKTDDKKPAMAHLRESGSIEQDADIVCFLFREDYYNKNSNRYKEADLIIAKNRSGASGMELPFIFESEFSRFRQKVEDKTE
jgi:replicative DNA helicase